MKTAFETLSEYPQLIGFGLNCCAPTDVTPFLKEVVPIRDKHKSTSSFIKLIVYPNSGQNWISGTG